MRAAVATLREALRKRRDAIRVLNSRISAMGEGEPAWWRPSARWWWMYGGYYGEIRTTHGANARTVPLHESLEALALLQALAQIDFCAFVDEMHDIGASPYRTPSSKRWRAPHDVALGVTFSLASANGLDRFVECMYGANHPPGQAFVDTVAWLQKEMEGSGGFRVRPIPVRLWVSGCDDLTATLRGLLHHITMQQSELQNESSGRGNWGTVARFQIVEVSIESWSMHVDALPLVEQLQEQRVFIPRLPRLKGDDTSLKARYGLTQSLRYLFLREAPELPSPPCIERVSLCSSIPKYLLVGCGLSTSTQRMTCECGPKKDSSRVRNR